MTAGSEGGERRDGRPRPAQPPASKQRSSKEYERSMAEHRRRMAELQRQKDSMGEAIGVLLVAAVALFVLAPVIAFFVTL